ncbi:MAG: DUF1583 domain-containing protein [Planctomycetota bacterium]
MSPSQFEIIEPISFGNAKVIARCLQLLVVSGRPDPQQAAAIIARSVDVELEKLLRANHQSADEYWELYAITTLVGQLAPNLPQLSIPPSKTLQKQAELNKRILWRLIELDPENATELFMQVLMSRLNPEAFRQRGTIVDLEPFADEELERLSRIRNRVANNELVLAQSNFSYFPGYSKSQVQAQQLIRLSALLANEYRLAGMEEKAKGVQMVDTEADLTYEELRAAMDYYVSLQEIDKAEEFLEQLLPQARLGTPPQMLSRSAVRTARQGDFYTDNHRALLDAEIARWALAKSKSRPPQTSPIGQGELRVYFPIPDAARFKIITVNAPLSARLLDSKLVHLALRDADTADSSSSASLGRRVPTNVQIQDEVIEHLEREFPGALEEEQKTRRILAAFCHWWTGRPEECFRLLNELSEQFPDDVDLQIETARLASEISRPRLALEKLDRFEPLDSKMMIRKEVAALNLAAQLGNLLRAKKAAERLLGMRLDVTTKLSLATTLQELGLREEANQILRRARRGRQKDERTELQIARAFVAAGDMEAAGEVATSLLRRLSFGRATRNTASYRSSVIRLLRETGRLESLIETAEQKVESNPKSLRAKQRLAELYTASGRQSEANSLLGSLADEKVTGVSQMLARAKILSTSNKKEDALALYLDAYEKDLSRFSYAELSQLVRSDSALANKLFERLDTFPIESLPVRRVSELVRLGRRNTSDAFKRVLGRIIKTYGATMELTSLTSGVDQAMLRSLPEYRDALLDVLAKPENYQPAGVVWQSNRYGSDGTLIGTLEDIVKFLKDSPESLERVRETANSSTSIDSKRATANFVLGLLSVTLDGEIESALQQMIDATQAEDGARPQVASGLVWQAGQILEKDAAVPRSSIIELYESIRGANSDPRVFVSSPQSRIESRLVNLYAQTKENEKAIELLLAMRSSSTVNISNPGYREYQGLQADYWICEQLMNAGGAYEAWVILQSTLADPSVFEEAVRWSRQSMEPKFETLAKKVVDEMNADQAIAYLERRFDQWETDLRQFPIDLMELDTKRLSSSENASSLSLALDTIAKSPEGAQRFPTLLDRAKKLIEKNADEMEAHALAMLIAAKMPESKTELVPLSERLFEIVPDPESLAVSDSNLQNNKPLDSDATGLSRYKDLYPVAVAAQASSVPEIQAVGQKLTSYLLEVSVASRDVSFSVAVAKTRGDVTGDIKQMLEVIRGSIVSGATLDNTIVEQLLEIAKTSAKAGDLESTCLAMKTALGNGPPISKRVVSKGRNPFAVQAQRQVVPFSTRQRNTTPSAEQTFRLQFDQITQSTEEHLGVTLRSRPGLPADTSQSIFETAYESYFGKRPTDEELNAIAAERSGNPEERVYETVQESAEEAAAPVEVDREGCGRMLDAYLAVLFPTTDPPSIELYAKLIFPTSERNSTALTPRSLRASEITVSSVAQAACRLAVLCDRVEEVREQARVVAETGVRAFECSVVQLQLAAAVVENELKTEASNVSWADLDAALKETATIMKGRLRSSNASASSSSSPSYNSTSLATIQEAISIETELNDAIHAIWPVFNANVLSPEHATNKEFYPSLAETMGEVLSMMQNHLSSNLYTRTRLHSLKDTLRTIAPPLVAGGGKVERMRLAIENEIRPLLATAPTLQRQQSQWTSLVNIFDAWARRGNIKFVDGALRRAALLRPVGTRLDVDRVEASLCLAVSQLEDAERLRWLMDFTLGKTPRDKIVFLAGRLHYETPPLRFDPGEATKKSVEALYPSNSDYVVVNTLTMLVDEAIRRGRAEELRGRLTEKREKPGDAADIGLALLRLTDARAENERMADLVTELTPTLDAVKKQIMAGPIKNAQYYPELEAQLVFRLAAMECPKTILEPLVSSLKSRAINGKREYLAATINRASARTGLGAAAGANSQRLPDDFIVVDIPRPTRGAFDLLSPVYVERPDGGIHGTGGMGFGHLLFRYPLAGDFSFTARIKDQDEGDANVSFGGVIYGANGSKSGFVKGSGDRGETTVPVPSAEPDALNEESVELNGQTVVGTCNGKPFVTDQRTRGFPFVSVVHDMTQTIEIDELRFSGNPTIPREVNLLDQQLRGWSDLWSSSKVETLSLPTGNGGKDEVKSDAEKQPQETESVQTGKWCLHDGELRFERPNSSRDPLSTLQYLRPLMDGESIEFEFWWDEEVYRFNFTMGRSALILTAEGSYWGYFPKRADLASLVSTENKNRGKKLKRLFPDNAPLLGWNRLVATRNGNEVAVELNGEALESIELRKFEKPGVYRKSGTSARVRKIRLTGDWPETFPQKWLAN